MNRRLIVMGGMGLAFAVAGCSSDTANTPGGDAGPDGPSSGGKSGSGGSGGKAGSDTDAARGGSGGGKSDGGTVTLSGVAVDITDGDATKNFDATKYPALSGVKVCVYGDATIPCVTTSADGKYALALPPGLSGYLSYEKDTYAPMLYGVSTMVGQNIDAPAMLMTTSAYRDAFGRKAGIEPDPATGEILFGATTLGPSSTPFHEFFGATELFYVGGFSIDISPAAKAGPFFTSATWAPDAALKVSSAAGWGFFQAAPGDYTLTITHPGMTCGSTTTKVVKGYSTTYVGILCTPNASDAGTEAGSTSTTPDSGSAPDSG